jgi:hypothetical protein
MSQVIGHSTGRAVLKCRSCKHAGQVHYRLRDELTEAWNGPHYTTYIQLDGATTWKRVDQCRSKPMAWALSRTCPDCDSYKVTVNVVKGTVVESKVCDGRCMAATGPNCECSCGGENHGGGHGTF